MIGTPGTVLSHAHEKKIRNLLPNAVVVDVAARSSPYTVVNDYVHGSDLKLSA